MRGERTGWLRHGLWPLLTVGWLILAAAGIGESIIENHAQPTGESLNTPSVAPSDEEQVEPQRGIRPPWREPLIPEQRKERETRKRAAHV